MFLLFSLICWNCCSEDEKSHFRKSSIHNFIIKLGPWEFQCFLQKGDTRRLHLVLKIEIKGENFAYSLQLWLLTRIIKIWDRRYWPPSKIKVVENGLHLTQCSDQPKILSKCTYLATSPIEPTVWIKCLIFHISFMSDK